LATPAVASAADPSLILAKRYAPVVRLVKEQGSCKSGEAFVPTNVNLAISAELIQPCLQFAESPLQRIGASAGRCDLETTRERILDRMIAFLPCAQLCRKLLLRLLNDLNVEVIPDHSDLIDIEWDLVHLALVHQVDD
jgi:hypothetical protein